MAPETLTSPTAAITVAIATPAIAAANWLDLLGDWLGIAAVTGTIILTMILIAKHWTELRLLQKEENDG